MELALHQMAMIEWLRLAVIIFWLPRKRNWLLLLLNPWMRWANSCKACCTTACLT